MVAPLPWLVEPSHAALAAVREHPALLIQGPPGVGQFELALMLAQAWLCEGDAAARPCGVCASCRLMQAHNHPDFLPLLPEVLWVPLGWAAGDDEEASPQTAGASAKKPSKEIKIDAVRSAIAFSQTTSSRGRAKVVVIFPAERMNAVSANALLKTLEEPPGVLRFVLATGDPQALPATVRSRCQALQLAAPPAAIACRWLEEQGVEQAATLLAASGGQPLEALAYGAEGIDASALARLPAALLAGDASGFTPWSLTRAIDLLHKLCHDAMLGAIGVAPRYFIGLPAMPGLDLQALIAWAEVLSRAARHAEHPLNAGLLVESLVLQGQRACLGKAAKGATARGGSLHSVA